MVHLGLSVLVLLFLRSSTCTVLAYGFYGDGVSARKRDVTRHHKLFRNNEDFTLNCFVGFKHIYCTRSHCEVDVFLVSLSLHWAVHAWIVCFTWSMLVRAALIALHFSSFVRQTNLHKFVRLHFQYSSFTRWLIHLAVRRVFRFFPFVNRIQCACTNTILDKADTPFVVWCLSSVGVNIWFGA